MIKIQIRLVITILLISQHNESFSQNAVFKYWKELCSCEGILCNAGFETPSEALHLGKKLMVIPMKRQYEQECNAEALKRLGISVLYDINDDFEHSVTKWISSKSVYSPECANALPIIVHKIDEFVSSRL